MASKSKTQDGTGDQTATGGSAGKRATAKKASPKKATARRKTAESGEPVAIGGGPALVIVESPKKARSIDKFLGGDYIVKASMGHVRDLPKRKLGLDVGHGYAPSYEVVPAKKDTISELKRAAARADMVYLATDPDREGEAIAWHLQQALELPDERVRRVTFHEITERAVKEAFGHTTPINMDLVNAQQARRFLDRIVGYQLSPLLWKKIMRHLSAGRVQSVAVRLIADRERDIRAFVSEEYWKIAATVSPVGATEEADRFEAALVEYNGAKFEATNGTDAHAVRDVLSSSPYVISRVDEVEKLDRADAPFKTSTLQQQAAIRLRFSGKRTMKVAQELYEGIDVNGSGPVGLITYMRTDSLRVSDEAMTAVREKINADFGEKYVPAKPIRYAAGKLAQEAHEAIRPTDLAFTPERIRGQLSHDQFRLYQLIYARFVASQMAPAVFTVTDVAITAGPGVFKAQGKILKFDGHRRVWPPGGKSEDALLPALSAGQALDLHSLDATQHFTQPPPRFSEATLIKALEKEAIGRPSTYAPIIQTIQDRQYVEQKERRFFATELGMAVTEFLVERFPKILDLKFTAQMEDELDGIAAGQGGHGQGPRRVLPPVPGGAEVGRAAGGEGPDPHRRDLPRLRCADGDQVQPHGQVPELLEVLHGRVQGDPADRRAAPRRGRRQRARLPQVQQAPHDPPEQAGREVPLLLGLPRMQGVVQHGRGGQPRAVRPGDGIYLREVRQADGAARGNCAGPSWVAPGIPSAAMRCKLTTRASRSRRSRWRSPAPSAAARWPCGAAAGGRSWAAPITPSAAGRRRSPMS